MTSIKNIKRIFSNRDVRVVSENLFYLTVLQLVNYVFPLITIPYLARVIGVEKFGEIAFATAIIHYFQTIVDYGFSYTATRDIAKNRDDLNSISEIFSSVMWSKFILIIISFILLIGLIITIPTFYKIRILLLLTFCMIPGYVMFPVWLFQGLERMKYVSILNFFARAIFTLLVFIFIKDQADFILQPLLVASGFFISGIIAMYIIIINYGITLKRPSFNSIKLTIKNSTDVFINQLFPNLYKSFSTLLLGFWGGAYANGILDAANRFILISQQIMQVLSRTFFPFLSRNINRHSLYAKGNLILSACISALLFFGSQFLIHFFYTDEFNDAILILKVLSLSPIFLALVDIYGTNYMIIQKHERVLRNITIRTSLIGFCIAFPLVYFYNFLGAALTIVITRILLGLAISSKAIKIKRMKPNMIS